MDGCHVNNTSRLSVETIWTIFNVFLEEFKHILILKIYSLKPYNYILIKKKNSKEAQYPCKYTTAVGVINQDMWRSWPKKYKITYNLKFKLNK